MLWKSATTVGSLAASSIRRASCVFPAPAGPLIPMLGMVCTLFHQAASRPKYLDGV